ncbi:MAG: DUF2510 domain-containing protein [Propionibacteriaceae bacterium]|jgi:hypothetical protein|nr:DUF2510 domain-containing protein [Propionibacteriaceae bacterium]
MSAPGWYPDPGGQAGLFRYWTGAEWTPAVTSDPYNTPAPQSGFQASQPLGGQPLRVQSSGMSAARRDEVFAAEQPARRKSGVGWIIAIIVLALAVVAGLVLVFGRQLGVSVPSLPESSASVEQNICPSASDQDEQTSGVYNGRVYGGALSYQELGSPWSEVEVETRVPYAAQVPTQIVVDQENYDGSGGTWVSSVLVADLYVGDGFGSAKVGAETILKCVLGVFYSDAQVTSNVARSEKHDVSGHSGWLIETNLSFSIPGLNATSENVLLLVASTGSERYSLFYSSVPNTSSELIPDVQAALASLTIEG